MSYHNNTNLAYDLSLFDRASREKERNEKRAQNPKIRMTAAPSVSRSGSMFKVAVTALVIFGALCAVNYSNTMVDDAALKIENQQEELRDALDDNELLQNRLDTMVNTSYIEQYAEETLGMTKVSPSQKEYISVNTEKLVQVEKQESLGFIDGLKSWWEEVLEYIGF